MKDHERSWNIMKNLQLVGWIGRCFQRFPLSPILCVLIRVPRIVTNSRAGGHLQGQPRACGRAGIDRVLGENQGELHYFREIFEFTCCMGQQMFWSCSSFQKESPNCHGITGCGKGFSFVWEVQMSTFRAVYRRTSSGMDDDCPWYLLVIRNPTLLSPSMVFSNFPSSYDAPWDQMPNAWLERPPEAAKTTPTSIYLLVCAAKPKDWMCKKYQSHPKSVCSVVTSPFLVA